MQLRCRLRRRIHHRSASALFVIIAPPARRISARQAVQRWPSSPARWARYSSPASTPSANGTRSPGRASAKRSSSRAPSNRHWWALLLRRNRQRSDGRHVVALARFAEEEDEWDEEFEDEATQTMKLNGTRGRTHGRTRSPIQRCATATSRCWPPACARGHASPSRSKWTRPASTHVEVWGGPRSIPPPLPPRGPVGAPARA